jgi:hypothetical protein
MAGLSRPAATMPRGVDDRAQPWAGVCGHASHLCHRNFLLAAVLRLWARLAVAAAKQYLCAQEMPVCRHSQVTVNWPVALDQSLHLQSLELIMISEVACQTHYNDPSE